MGNKYNFNNKKNSLFKKFLHTVCLVFLVIIVAVVAKIYLPNFNKIDYKQSIGLSDNSPMVMFNNDFVDMENPVMIEENELFLPVDFIKKYIDPYIFWDKEENKLTITNEKNVIRMKTEELQYFVNNEPLKLNIPIYNVNSIAYIPYNFLKDFYIDFNFDYYTVENEIKNILSIKSKDLTEELYYLKENSIIRTGANKKEPIIVKHKDLGFQKMVALVPNSSEENGYLKISTKDGYIGYINKKSIKEKVLNEDNSYNEEKKPELESEPTEVWKPDGKTNLVFEQMTNVEAIRASLKKTYPKGIDVLVPTFFSFLNENGDIRNLADKTYVENAHSNGFQVWGLLTDNFDKKISHSVLSSTETREYVIKQLLAFVSIYNLDGINIDFESVPTNDGEYFIQFLREFAPLLKKQGAILSVDLFVPKPWTAHYMREEVGKIADYAIVMGYDEHYAGSKNAGSVASISWSKEGITSTLKENIPKEKLILAVPFYTRIWTEENIDGKIKLSSKAYGMNKAYEFITEKGGQFTWLENMGQYYAEVKEGNKTYKVWLEDERSLEKRLDLILQYDIAGCAAWKLWLEKEEVWNILNEKLK